MMSGNRWGSAGMTLLIVLSLLGVSADISFAASGGTIRVSVASDGAQANGESVTPVVSADGRYVAFESEAHNLVPGDTNRAEDIFVYDRQLGATTRVSIASNGAQTSDFEGSLLPSISADGRFVAFQSFAGNLVAGDTNDLIDVFVHDRDADQDGIFDEPGARVTTRISVASDGSQAQAPLNMSGQTDISADGRFVAFTSFATNLVPNDTNGEGDVFVHDRSTGITTRVSVSGSGSQANGPSTEVSISADGRFVAFGSNADNLVANDSNNRRDIFVHDRQTGATALISQAADGTAASGPSGEPSISADGRYVAFSSEAANLLTGDSNGARDIFVKDRVTGAIVRVSNDANGLPSNAGGSWPSISADGRHVAFQSVSSDLVPDDTNNAQDVFVHDRDTDGDGVFDEPGAFGSSRASIATDGTQSNGHSLLPELSAGGQYVTFYSAASNLVPDDTNSLWDVFVHERSLTSSNQPPSVEATGGDVDEGDTFSQSGSFTDPDSASWTATVDYGDGDGEQDLPLSEMTFQLNHVYADDLVVNTGEVCVIDDGGAEGCDDFVVVVNNVSPTTDAGSDQAVGVGEAVTLEPATFTDPGALDTHTATINWGDGSAVENGTVDQAARTVSGSHTYSQAGQYTVEVCVTDDDGGVGCDSFGVNVSEQADNQAPIVDLGDALALAEEGSPYTRNGIFADPDSSSWTATVDYGDGGGPVNLLLNGTTFSLNHSYADDGVYTVEVCVTDDSNEAGCDTLPVTVDNVAPSVLAGQDRFLVVGDTTHLNPASFSDPGTADTHTATIDWGDGSPVANAAIDAATNRISGSHTYVTAGNYTAMLCVTDDDGAQACDSVEVTVQALQSGDEVRLCASRTSGAIRIPSGTCGRFEVTLNLPDDLPLTLCANRVSGELSYAGQRSCGRYARQVELPDDAPIDVCVHRVTGSVRYVSAPSGCSRYEQHHAIGRHT